MSPSARLFRAVSNWTNEKAKRLVSRRNFRREDFFVDDRFYAFASLNTPWGVAVVRRRVVLRCVVWSVVDSSVRMSWEEGSSIDILSVVFSVTTSIIYNFFFKSIVSISDIGSSIVWLFKTVWLVLVNLLRKLV